MPNWFWWEIAAFLVMFGIPAFLLRRWLKKHPESGAYTAVMCSLAAVWALAMLARWHSILTALIVSGVGVCLWADAKQRHSRRGADAK